MRRSNRPLIIVLSLLLVAILATGLWLLRQGLQPEEARENPSVVEMTPAEGESVSRATNVEIVFDQRMDRPSVEQAITLDPPFEYEVVWRDEGVGDRLILHPLQALSWDTTYRIEIGTTALNEEGRPLKASRSTRFSTRSEVNVAAAFPHPGNDRVDVHQPITVRFDRPLVEVPSLEEQEDLPQPLLLDPPVEGVGRWLAPDMYGFYPVEGLSRGTTYEVSVSPLVAPGMELPESFGWSFVTEGPRVEASFPFDGASEVASATTIRLLFAQPMDRTSVEENFRLSASGENVPVAGEFRWEDDETLLFVPREPLEPAAEYEIKLEDARADGGARGLMSPYRALFATVDFLAVESVQPAPGSVEVSIVPTDTVISVQFNHPVVPLVGLAGRANLPEPLSFSPSVEGEGEWITTSLYQFRPAEPLEPSTEYVVTVDSSLQDTLGTYQNESYSWSFTTEFPRVIRVEPSNPRRHIPPAGPISLRFNQPMDEESAAQAFSMSGPEGPVAGEVEWAEDGQVLRFYPEPALAPGMEYSLQVAEGAQGAVGGATREVFEAPVVAAPELAVTDVAPAPGATNVGIYDAILITFNTPLDPEVFNSTRPLPPLSRFVSIEPEPEGQLGQCCYDPETLLLSVYVDGGLEPDTDYTVSVSGITDESGQVLDEPYSWSFRTGELPPSLMLSSQTAGILGTYTPYTPTLQVINHMNISRLDFTLFEMTEDEMLGFLTGENRYDLWNAFTGEPSRLIESWSVTPDGVPNEVTQVVTRLPPDDRLSSGLYFFRVTAPERSPFDDAQLEAKQMVVLTSINLTVKRSPDEVLIWATDVESGQPAGNIPVRVIDEQGTTILEGRTDEEGILRESLGDNAPLPYSPLLVLSYDAEGNVTGIASDSLAPFHFDLFRVGIPNNAVPPLLYGTLYTERPIYRPGQTVYFRGILRQREGPRLITPSLQDGTVQIQNAEGDTESVTVALSPFGTFYGEFDLPPEAPVGGYNLIFTQDELSRCYSADYCEQEQLYAYFNVAEYDPPEYEVQVQSEQESAIRGDDVDATVTATYFAGGALSDATYEWRLYSRPYDFRVPGLPGYWSWQEWAATPFLQEGGGLGVSASGRGSLDEAGQDVIPVDTSLVYTSTYEDDPNIGARIGSQILTVEADVRDVDGQVTSGRGEIIVHAGEFYIGLSPDSFMSSAGQPFNLNVATATTEGILEGGHEVEISFSQRQYYYVHEGEGVGFWTAHFTDTLVASTSTTTGEDGLSTVTFTPEEGGIYTALATAEDSRGNEVTSRSFFWVSEDGNVLWEQNGDNFMDLVADRAEYQVGDVARILVPTPYQGMTALVTVERFGLEQAEVRLLESTSEYIEVPITEESIPNIIVSVVAVKGITEESPLPTARVGYINLPVSRAPKLLNVELSRPEGAAPLEPGQDASFLLRVTDHEGNPMQAELSLAVVDKAVLALSEQEDTPLADTFWSERPDAVRSGSTFMANLDRVAAGRVPEGGGLGGGGGDFLLTSVRANLQDTAYWKGDIVTDENGEATIGFTLPDNLTTWVLTARGVTEGEPLVGEVRIESLASLSFFVEPELPRFMIVGDEAELRVVVHNNTGANINSLVTLQATGVTVTDGEESRSVTVPAGGRRVVSFFVAAEAVEEAEITIAAEGGGQSDGIRLTIPIYYPVAPEIVASSGLIRPGEGAAVESIHLPEEADRARGELTVELSPSLAGATQSALAWIRGYPFESIETTVSQLLPNVATARALEELGWSRPDTSEALETFIPEDIARLEAWQNEDGGWGWWQNGESHPWLSAYSALALYEARATGFNVPQGVLDGATSYLHDWLDETEEIQDNATLDTRAFVLYVLSEVGSPDEARTVALFDRHSLLDTDGRAFLLVALDNTGSDEHLDRVQTLASELTASAILSATGAHWEVPAEEWSLGTSLRATAIALRALVRVQPEHMLLPQAVNWLMDARQVGHWETTQETAWAILALTDYLLASGELAADYSYEVVLNDEVLLSEQVSPETLAESRTLEVAVTDLLSEAANELIITRVPESGEGRLYYAAWLRYYLSGEELPARNEGIGVTRSYESVDSLTLESTGAPPEETEVGDIVLVRLRVEAPNDLYFFTLEDWIPAGFEIMDPSLATNAEGVEAPQQTRVDERGPFWFDAWSHSMIRDEKVALFADRLGRGTYEYTYYMRATVPGTFNVLPAIGYQQYHPEVFGRTEGEIFTIAP